MRPRTVVRQKEERGVGSELERSATFLLRQVSGSESPTRDLEIEPDLGSAKELTDNECELFVESVHTSSAVPFCPNL